METSGQGRPPGSHIQPLSCRCDPVQVSPWWFRQSGQRTFRYDPNSRIVWWIHCCQVHSNPVLQKHMSSYSLYTTWRIICVTVYISDRVERYTPVQWSKCLLWFCIIYWTWHCIYLLDTNWLLTELINILNTKIMVFRDVIQSNLVHVH